MMRVLFFLFLLLNSFMLNAQFFDQKFCAPSNLFFQDPLQKKVEVKLQKKNNCPPLQTAIPVAKPKLKKTKKDHTHKHAVIPWKNVSQKISEPPQLMGKQMGVVQTPGIKPLGYELDGNVKVFRLIAQPIEHVIVDEAHSEISHLVSKKNKIPKKMKHTPKYQKIKCWGYNGSTPGPTLEATEGDRVRIILKNELPEPTSIHWHGMEVPNNQDGAAPETQKPVMPGETYTYEFTLYQSGTVMYHSGYNVMRQDHMGLQGTFVYIQKNTNSRLINNLSSCYNNGLFQPEVNILIW